jgi:hypothetical protein
VSGAWQPLSNAYFRTGALFFGDFAGDHPALDVADALIDLADSHIAVDALDRKVGDAALAAVDLDRVGGDPLGHLGREELGHRRLLDAGGPSSCAPRRRAPGRALQRSGLAFGEADGEAEVLAEKDPAIR